jgi:hypothetical protein
MKLLAKLFLPCLLVTQLWADVGLFEVQHPEKATIQAFNAPRIELTIQISKYPEKGHPDFTQRKEIDAENPEGHLVDFHKDRRMSWMGEPGGTFVSGFTLKWEGKEIIIPDRDWNDLDRMRINLIRHHEESPGI